MAETIYWYDYETSGLDPALDRPLQFAGMRTDGELRPLGYPTTLYCRLSEDVVPAPEALLVSGLSVDRLQREGLPECDFIGRVHTEFMVPGTCVAGYNNLRFDDEFTRHALYRNFFDPYAREWQQGNSRWDVIDLLRTAHALRPDGLNWPTDADGVASFRLEQLTRANGIAHGDAHDALGDVRATIALSSLLKQRQPRLFAYLFNLRHKRRVLEQLYPLGKHAVVHISGMYPAAAGCLAIVLPLCTHPGNANGIVVYDLAVDPTPLIRLPPDEIRRLLFTARDDLPEGEERIPLKTLHINRSPSVAPLSTLSAETCARFGVDRSLCEAHFERLRHASGVVEKIQEALAQSAFPERTDPDQMLYAGGFLADRDRELLDEVRQTPPAELAGARFAFGDARLPEMLFRYRARNYPQTLGAGERVRWQEFAIARWGGRAGIAAYREQVAVRLEKPGLSERDRAVLTDLARYADELARLAEPV